MEQPHICQLIEAALLSAGRPLKTGDLMALCNRPAEPELAQDDIEQALARIGESCDGRGLELVQVASGWRMQVRAELTPQLLSLWQERPSKYSRALLETLAIIAYKQPTTRGEIDEMRGVSSSNVHIKTLLERGWIRIAGHRQTPGRPAEYSTTPQFLDYFGLRNLKQLPSMAQIKAMVDEHGEAASPPAAATTQEPPQEPQEEPQQKASQAEQQEQPEQPNQTTGP